MTGDRDRPGQGRGAKPPKPRKPIRWWPAIVVLVLSASVLVWVWGFVGQQRQDRVVWTFPVVFFTLILLLLWVLFLSRMRWWIRLSVLAVALAATAFVFTGLRIEGVSGDIVPIVTWKWAPPSDTLLETQAAPGAPGGVSRASVGSVWSYPQFLGPSRDGTLSGIELSPHWSSHAPTLLWRQPIGAGWSGFVVEGEFAVTHEQRGEEEMVTCYDAATGKLLWYHSDPARYESPIAGIGPRATPAIVDGRVYALGAAGTLNVLDLATGELQWSTNILEDSGAPVPTYGMSASPLVTGDLVIVAPGGKEGHSLAAYNKETGEKVWAGGDDPAAYSSPVLVELAGVPQVLLFTHVHLASHDPATGEVLWKHPWPPESEKVSQPVALPGDRVFLSSGYGVGGKLFQVRAGEEGGLSVELVWESRGLKAKFTNVVYKDGYLYGLDDGILVCLDPEDGQRKWKRGRYGHGQVILADDLLIVQAENGDVALVEATPEEYRELGRIDALDGKTWNHPALAGRRLFVRNDQEAACYELPGTVTSDVF